MADARVVHSLVEAAEAFWAEVHRGIVLTQASFYPHAVLGGTLLMWQEAGVVAVEMEVAALFLLASLHGSAAGAILAIDWNPLVDGGSRPQPARCPRSS